MFFSSLCPFPSLLLFSAYLKYEETFYTAEYGHSHDFTADFYVTRGAFTYTRPHYHKLSCMATFSVEVGYFYWRFHKTQPHINKIVHCEWMMNKRERGDSAERSLQPVLNLAGKNTPSIHYAVTLPFLCHKNSTKTSFQRNTFFWQRRAKSSDPAPTTFANLMSKEKFFAACRGNKHRWIHRTHLTIFNRGQGQNNYAIDPFIRQIEEFPPNLKQNYPSRTRLSIELRLRRCSAIHIPQIVRDITSFTLHLSTLVSLICSHLIHRIT